MVGSSVCIPSRSDWFRMINSSRNGNGLRHVLKKRVTIIGLRVIAFLLTPLSVILSPYRRANLVGPTVPNCLRNCQFFRTLQK